MKTPKKPNPLKKYKCHKCRAKAIAIYQTKYFCAGCYKIYLMKGGKKE